MLSYWHDLLFLFCLPLSYLFLPSTGWLCRVGDFGQIECSQSLPALHIGLEIIIIIIIIIIIVYDFAVIESDTWSKYKVRTI